MSYMGLPQSRPINAEAALIRARSTRPERGGMGRSVGFGSVVFYRLGQVRLVNPFDRVASMGKSA